jgi:hypothetical protein
MVLSLPTTVTVPRPALPEAGSDTDAEPALENRRASRERARAAAAAAAAGLPLAAVLKNFLTAESLDDKYDCGVCCTLVEAERRHSFTELPELLAVHLKLFDSYDQDGGSAGRAQVDCPAVLPVEHVSTEGGGSNATVVQYLLRAAVLHKGSSVRPDLRPPCCCGPFFFCG